MWENAAESTCVCICSGVLLSAAQKAEQAARMCLEPEGSVVCSVSGKQQLHWLSTARWWKSWDVWEERSVVVRQGWRVGHGLNRVGRVRAARHSCDRHTPAA